MLTISLRVNAQNYNGTEWWTRFTWKVNFPKKLKQDFEIQYRNQQANALVQERFRMYTFRWYIFFERKNFFIQLSPFTYFFREADETAVRETRFAQYAGYHWLKSKITFRSGLEQRFFRSEAGHQEELRWRTRLSTSWPINKSITCNVSNEFFIRDRWSGPEVKWFDQNRTNISGSFAFHSFTVEPGFSYQTRQITDTNIDNFNVFFLNVSYQRPSKTKED